ncbi:hypothetical protein EP7_000841 [Isosphaeraceae bacterium EP7]
MTDPMRDHQLHVELEENGNFRARIIQDKSGQLQLRIYAGSDFSIPIEWLMGILQRFSGDLQAEKVPDEGRHGQSDGNRPSPSH